MNGDDGSTASTAVLAPRARNARTSALVTVDLPAPGAPVRPITRLAVAGGFSSLSTERVRGSPFSTHEITRASARLSPAWTRPGSSAGLEGCAGPVRRRALGGALAHGRALRP